MTKSLKVIQTLLFALVILSLAACGTQPTEPVVPADATEAAVATDAPAAEEVSLTLGSWRTDDAEAWAEILAAFNSNYPNITVKFDPTNPPDYNATLRTPHTQFRKTEK